MKTRDELDKEERELRARLDAKRDELSDARKEFDGLSDLVDAKRKEIREKFPKAPPKEYILISTANETKNRYYHGRQTLWNKRLVTWQYSIKAADVFHSKESAQKELEVLKELGWVNWKIIEKKND